MVSPPYVMLDWCHDNATSLRQKGTKLRQGRNTCATPNCINTLKSGQIYQETTGQAYKTTREATKRPPKLPTLLILPIMAH